ncbi:MAG TPA: ABC transporter substrate-binding protein [Kineosporiaceae bacterium]|nr:ABC transporter substrate-binding protein [Kineosporiaceae bacterium]
MLGFTGDQFEAFRATVDPYAKSQGITINWAPTTNFNQLINTRVQGNNLPDIAMFPQPGVLRDLANRNRLTPLNDILDMPTLQNSMTPGTLDTGTVDGNLYGLLVSMNVKSLVYYPKQAFAEAGYTEPKSIPELLELTNKIRSSGKTPWCLGVESGAATGWPATDWFEDLILHQQGVDKYNQWVNHDIKFESPEVKQAAATFEQIAFTDGNVVGGRQSIASNNFNTAANPMFKNPPGCFLYKQGNFVAAPGGFPDSVIKNIDSIVGVFGFPPATAGGEDPVLGGGDLAALFSPQNEAAKKILKYMSTKDFGAEDAKQGNYISPHKDFDQSNYPNDVVRKAARVAYGATAFAFDGSDQMPGAVGSGSFWRDMTSWISGQQDLAEALKGIDDSWPTDDQ